MQLKLLARLERGLAGDRRLVDTAVGIFQRDSDVHASLSARGRENVNAVVLLELEVDRGQLSPAARRGLDRFQDVQRECAAGPVRTARTQRLDELFDPEPARLL